MLRSSGLVLIVSIFLGGCESTPSTVQLDSGAQALMHPRFAIPEPLLIEVDVQISEAGKPENIRTAESTSLAVQLKNTLQRARYWGAVSVVSVPNTVDEVLVSVLILKSNGEDVVLKVRVVDATGKEWFRQSFRTAATEEQPTRSSNKKAEMLQSLHNNIANRLAAHFRTLSVTEIQEIRSVAKTPIAEDTVFEGVLPEDYKPPR